MVKKSIETIKKELERKKEELISFLKPSTEHGEINPNDYDLSQQYQLSEQQSSLNSYNQSILSQIEIALKKIEEGSYGVCERCRKPIDPERLAIIPYANFCMDCLNRFPSKLIHSSTISEE
ncbi:MAG TPA: TraR/DksA C4-type zinc finger protein [Anaerolineaceae bacterium]|jgi:RNA polymerase-binding transcription factor DksA|nr:TraR/DksA C4-type zinc finger protein [Anaerolineaceae bacterium]